MAVNASILLKFVDLLYRFWLIPIKYVKYTLKQRNLSFEGKKHDMFNIKSKY